MKLNHCENEVIADCYQLANVQEVLVRGISGHSIIASFDQLVPQLLRAIVEQDKLACLH